jgi:cell division protein FtsW
MLMTAVVALLGLGVVMVHSAGVQVAGTEPAGPWRQALSIFLSRHTAYAALAVGLMLFASRLDVRSIFLPRGLKNPLWAALALSLGCVALTFVPGVGKSVNGATRWLQIDTSFLELTFQPSEMVKWTMIVAIAWWCAVYRGVMHRFAHGLLPPLALTGLACGLIVIEDLGTAALIAAVAGALLVAGGARIWQLLTMVPPAAAVCVAAIVQSPYRMQRLTTFLHPWEHPQGAGYHPIQSMLAFAEGGLTGSGLGNSIQKFYLPEDTTDFLFPILAEELGLAGCAAVVGLLLAILWLGFAVMRDCRDTFSRLLCLGFLLMLGSQAVMNIAVTTVVVPTKGIALPLLSAGGTGWVITAFAIGLIAALDNANALEAEANATSPSSETLTESSLALSRDRASADGSAADGGSDRGDDDSDGPRLRLVS